jgi:phospholipase/carboxylesterase
MREPYVTATLMEPSYSQQLSALQGEILEFLRTFESIQEQIRPGTLSDCQARLVRATGDTFRRFESSFARITPPSELVATHELLCSAVRELAKAYELFMSTPGREWTLVYLHSRAAFCRGLYLLFDLRAELPQVAEFFLAPGASAPRPADDDGTSRGFIHRERNEQRSDYTLYIPENYSKAQPLPLIVALHGGYGQGKEYIWTWLRPARSRGYAVLAPKSWDVTWDMSLPSLDSQSVLRMLDEVRSEYSIDPARIYLSGLSDGGIFTFIFGFENSHLFRGLAPVAGVLHPVIDSLLRQNRGKDTPLMMIHGVHDFIFPVAFARQAFDLLKAIGYPVVYKELPDWGHAYTYSINEQLVLPWFESLPPKRS